MTRTHLLLAYLFLMALFAVAALLSEMFHSQGAIMAFVFLVALAFGSFVSRSW